MSLSKRLVFNQTHVRRLTRALMFGILFCLAIPMTCVPQRLERGAKSADAYWEETGLGSTELETMLSPASCSLDEQSFLGCVNAIAAMAEKFNLALSLSGDLKPLTPDLINLRLTEKKELKDWENNPLKVSGSPAGFIELWKKIDREFVKENRSAVIAAGINAFLSVTKDPHTYILPVAYYEEVMAKADVRPLHLGFISRRVAGGAYVRKIFSESPADRAGLRKGDRILEVNDIGVARLNPNQFSEAIKVRSGDRIRLLVQRASTRLYIEIMKTDLNFPNVLSKKIAGQRDVGLITIHKFSRETCSLVRQHLISLQEQKLNGLILDLRDNPGGQVDEAACVAGLFVASGTKLFETHYNEVGRAADYYISEQRQAYTGPLAILINGGSASASEIVAGALKDLGRAKLVGERSFGKGSFQDGRIWAAHPKIAYFQTEGLYYFPTGWTPQLVGLEPDFKVTALEDETLREEDLYFSPIRPTDFWNGPQSLAWVSELNCQNEAPLSLNEDLQVEKAWALMNCENGSSQNERNGNL